MAETNDDLLDGDLEGDFGDLDAEEEDALLADDDYIYQQPEGGHLQGSIFIDNEDGGKTNSIHNKYYQGTSIDDVQDVAEGDEILEEEEDVLDLGVVDELESELDEGPIQGGPKTWRIQESTEQSVISEGGSKSNKLRNVNVSSSTRGMVDSATVESDDEKDEEQRSRFKTERTSGSNIISLKSPLKKTLADIPDSLDSVVPAQMPCIRGKRRGSNRGNRGGLANQQPLVVISTNIENMTEQTNHNFGNFRGNILRPPPRGRGIIQFQRPMRPPIQSFPPRRPPMMGPFPVNQGPRLMQQNMNLTNPPKIHINPHFRGGLHSVQAPSIRHEWGGDIQHQNGPPFQNQPQQIHRDGSWGHQGMISEPMMVQPEPNFYQPPQYHQQPMQYMHHNPEPQVFTNPPGPRDRLVCGDRITIQTHAQLPPPSSNFEELPERTFNNAQFPDNSNAMYQNQYNMNRSQFQPHFEDQAFPPRQEFQEQHILMQHHYQEIKNDYNQEQIMFHQTPPHQPHPLPPQQFFSPEPPSSQPMFRPPPPINRPPPMQNNQQFQQPVRKPSPRGQFRGGIRTRLGKADNRVGNKRMGTSKQVNNDIPFKQARFEQRKGGPVMSNLHEVKTVDNIPPEILPDTTTEPEEEDEETKQYRLKIEEQKKLRQKIVAEKEARRQQAAEMKIAQKYLNVQPSLGDGPPGVDPEPSVIPGNLNPISITNQTVERLGVPMRESLKQIVRGPVSKRIGTPIPGQSGIGTKRNVSSAILGTSTKGFKIVTVRTKDGNIQTKRVPFTVDGSKPMLPTRCVQNVHNKNQKMKIQSGNQPMINRGQVIPVRAQGLGRGGLKHITVGNGRGIPNKIPLNTIGTTEEKLSLTVGQRFTMQRNQQQIETKPTPPKSNRIVMPSGLIQFKPVTNTVPIPNSCLLTIDNLSASTNKSDIIRMAQQVGKIKQLKLDTKLKRAILRFNEPSSAAQFFQRFQRKMVDLSMINITVVPE